MQVRQLGRVIYSLKRLLLIHENLSKRLLGSIRADRGAIAPWCRRRPIRVASVWPSAEAALGWRRATRPHLANGTSRLTLKAALGQPPLGPVGAGGYARPAPPATAQASGRASRCAS